MQTSKSRMHFASKVIKCEVHLKLDRGNNQQQLKIYI